MTFYNLPMVKVGLTALCLLGSSALWALDFGSIESAFDNPHKQEHTISIATGGSPIPLLKAPSTATLVTADVIQAMGATDLDEVLESVPGIHVSYDQTYNPIYSLRGIHSRFNPQMLVLINGIPVTNIYLGNRNQIWGGMPVEAIKRLEIIRGPGSALYGADAFAGVINIITKDADYILKNEVGIRAGSFDTLDFWTVQKASSGGFDIAWMVETHNTDGHKEIIEADAQTASDAAKDTSASLAPGPVSLSRENIDARVDIKKGHWRLRSGIQFRSDVGWGAGVAQALDPNGRARSRRRNMDLTYENFKFMEDLGLNLEFSFFDATQEIEEDLILFPPGSDVGDIGVFPEGYIGNPELFERHYRIQATTHYRSQFQHDISAGLGYKFDDVYRVRETKNFGIDPATGLDLPAGSPLVDVTDTPYVFLPEASRENAFFFLQDIWGISYNWELTTGIRYDHYSDFGDVVNPRAALMWYYHPSGSLKLLYGQAFRAPSFAETLNQNNPVVLGNSDLKPETLKSLELALNCKTANNAVWLVSLFDYEWEDVIRFVPDGGNTTATAQNEGRQTGYGFEVELMTPVASSFNLLTNYSYQRSEDETHSDQGFAPRHKFYFSLEWLFAHAWSATTQLTWVGDRQREAGDTRPNIDNYSLLDLHIKKLYPGLGFQWMIKVKNVLDEDAQEPSELGDPTAIPGDLPLAGRSLWGEIRYAF